MPDFVDFDAFLSEWLTEVKEGDPPSTELGRRFAQKLLRQWFEVDSTSADVVYCDGTGDGGIDVAYLDRGDDETAASEGAAGGHTWYLLQSKYGTAFSGVASLLHEGQKVIDTLDRKRPNLSSLAEGLLERLLNFREQASERDRIVLVFATERGLHEDEKRALSDLRNMGRGRLGSYFDVESISVEGVYQRTLEESERLAARRLRVPIKGDFIDGGADLLVGSVRLTDLYDFLKTYREATEDLDQLYEKNVRRFLGSRRKVNRAIQETLRENPQKFGLYNNGITVVVSEFHRHYGIVELTEPYVVNGCQTTRTIWEVFQQRLEAGGTGTNPALESWKQRASEGMIVVKVASVGDTGHELLQAITRYTNSQNAVREQDFLALTSDFRAWAAQMAEQYGLYLEIQRGGWESRKALQRQRPNIRQYTQNANAFDLVKVYGAGWLGEAGLAFGKNAPFLPNGSVFNRIIRQEGVVEGEHFGVDDLYAAYLLYGDADKGGFGRGADKMSRRQTRYLFYMIVIELLKEIFFRAQLTPTHRALSLAMLQLHRPQNTAALQRLHDTAVEVIDSYLTQGSENTVFDEPAYVNTFNFDLNAFLKWEQLGKSDQHCPRFRQLLAVTRQVMGQRIGGQASCRDLVASAIREIPSQKVYQNQPPEHAIGT
jgi:hypothetical protein